MANGEDVDFYSIENFSPVIRGNRGLNGIKEFETLPVFLKTHFPCTSSFKRQKSVVIVRNPFLVIPSYRNYMIKARDKRMPGVEDFAFHWRYGLNAWAAFMKSWEKSGTLILRYEDLIKSPVELLNNMYLELGYEIPQNVIEQAIEYSSRDKMKKVLREKGDPHNSNDFNFIRKEDENIGIWNMYDSVMNDSRTSELFKEQLFKYDYGQAI
jgi:hypothetical protein